MQAAIARIAAPGGSEQQRAQWVARRFRALGLVDVRSDEAGNVIGRRPGTLDGELPSVAVCAHMDTVFPEDTALAITQHGARLTGPGVGDNARGLAVTLAIARAIDGRHLRTRAPVDFVATTGEEGRGDLRGAKHYFAVHGGTTRAAIALDGAGDDRIVHRALASRRLRVTIAGPGGHSWNAFGVANPVHALSLAAARMARVPLPTDPRATLSIGRIGGGISVNAIPEDAWLEVDLRALSPTTLESLHAAVLASSHAAVDDENARRTPGTDALACTIDLIGDRPGGETAPDHPLVQLAVEATRVIGREPELAAASTDANVPISLGIPAIAIGAGGQGGDAHTPAEWYDNTDGTLGMARALAVVVGAAGLDGAPE